GDRVVGEDEPLDRPGQDDADGQDREGQGGEQHPETTSSAETSPDEPGYSPERTDARRRDEVGGLPVGGRGGGNCQSRRGRDLFGRWVGDIRFRRGLRGGMVRRRAGLLRLVVFLVDLRDPAADRLDEPSGLVSWLRAGCSVVVAALHVGGHYGGAPYY